MSRKIILGLVFAAGIVAIGVGGTVSLGAQGFGPGSGMMGRGSGPGMMFGQGYGPGRSGYGPGMMGGYGPGMMGGCGGFGPEGQSSSYVNGRVAFLKAELAITDAQKGAWDAYAEAMTRNLQSMQGMWATMKTVFEAKTPVERLDAHLAAMDARVGALKDMKPALVALYGALSAEQKTKADELLTEMGCMM